MGYLTEQQMQRAAKRYRLGMSRDGGVIFWQIDQLGQVYDGKVMYYREDCHRDHHRNPTWVNSELKRFYLKGHPQLAAEMQSAHCLFGTHLLTKSLFCCTDSGGKREDGRGQTSHIIAVVEAEKTAVIMSEVFPQYLWLAAGGLYELNVFKLFPLRHHPVVLFPDTDATMTAYSLWYRIAQDAMKCHGGRITVSDLLERKATTAQKAAKIDLVDYLLGEEVRVL